MALAASLNRAADAAFESAAAGQVPEHVVVVEIGAVPRVAGKPAAGAEIGRRLSKHVARTVEAEQVHEAAGLILIHLVRSLFGRPIQVHAPEWESLHDLVRQAVDALRVRGYQSSSGKRT